MNLLSDALAAPPSCVTTPTIACESTAAAWQKEFARASTASWFHGPLPPPQPGNLTMSSTAPVESGDDLPASGHPPAPRLQGGPQLVRLARTPPSVPEASQSPRSEGEDHERSRPGTASLVLHYPACEAADANASTCTPAASGTGTAPRATAVPTETAPIRVHAEVEGEGVIAWLGIDGDAAFVEARSSELVDRLLRQAREKGQKLAAVICNGRPAYGDGAPQRCPGLLSGETP